MTSTFQITYHNSSTGQIILPVSTEILLDANDPVFTFNEVLEGVNLEKYIIKNRLGRDGYNNISLLKIILFSFMVNVRSTRCIEKLCANDIRLMWIGGNIRPSHNTIAKFIKFNLTDSIDNVFTEVNRFFIKKENINTDVYFIDGSKIEAYANKYSFVWKKATLKHQSKLFLKISKTFTELEKAIKYYDLDLNLEIKEIYQPYELITCIEVLSEYLIDNDIPIVYGKGKRKHEIQRYYDEISSYLSFAEKYEEIIETCGEDRNSYSKTDNDATFMRMKDDHMRNGQLKAGYNVQIGVSDEYILNVEVYQDRSDFNTFEPFLNSYKRKYGFMPKYPVADAGYGSFDNYLFCLENQLELVQKYVMYSKEKESSFKKKIFNSRNFDYMDNGDIKCPMGHKFELIKKTINNKGKNPKEIEHYKCLNCHDCPSVKECTKSKSGYRSLQVCRKQKDMEAIAKANLDGPLGIMLKIERSIQVEGAFGVIKENMKYRRLSRRGIENVKTELTLVCLAYNLKKYHNNKMKRLKKEKSLFS